MADVIDKELAKRVGMNITNLLILNGKTQKEMCDHFKWGYSTVSSWCNGTRLHRMDKVGVFTAIPLPIMTALPWMPPLHTLSASVVNKMVNNDVQNTKHSSVLRNASNIIQHLPT